MSMTDPPGENPAMPNEEALQRLWKRMDLAHDIDVEAIAMRVFASVDAPSAPPQGRDAQAIGDAARAIFQSFADRHQPAPSRWQTVATLAVAGLVGVVLAATLLTSFYGVRDVLPRDAIDSYFLWRNVAILALVLSLSLAIYWLLQLVPDKSTGGVLALAASRQSFAVLGFTCLAILAVYNVGRQSDLAVDQKFAQSAMFRVALERYWSGDWRARCEQRKNGIAEAGLWIKADSCLDVQTVYSLMIDQDTEEWKAVIGAPEAEITWNKLNFLGRHAPVRWTFVPGTAIESRADAVILKGADGKMRSFVPDRTAHLPPVGRETVAIVSTDGSWRRTLFLDPRSKRGSLTFDRPPNASDDESETPLTPLWKEKDQR